MLTKQERAAIAKRASSYNDGTFYFADIYKCLFGEEVLDITSEDEDTTRVIGCLIDLCDTSNMVELPLDKDGEVIHVGDTVWRSGKKETVKAIEIRDSEARIHFVVPLGCESWSSPELITHKKPVTIVSLNERLRHVLDKGQMSAWSMAELFDIADQLESLGDSDDYEDKGEDSNGPC